jgi:Ca2+/Na+ antiporter
MIARLTPGIFSPNPSIHPSIHPSIILPLYILAIILFSGLGDIETAQETLSVGVGALAGSTIMLLTVPWALSIYAGRVDLTNGKPDYMGKPKLSSSYSSLTDDFQNTGVTLTLAVRHGGVIMAVTTLPYFLIQVPAAFLHGPTEEVAQGEHWWALLGFCVCLAGLVYYMRLQLKFSQEGQDKDKRVAAIKKALSKGQISLSGALHTAIQKQPQDGAGIGTGTGEYQSLGTTGGNGKDFSLPPPEAASYLTDILGDAFKAYDSDESGALEVKEIRMFFKDFHENISESEIERLFQKADKDGGGSVSFDEFLALAYNLITSNDQLNAAVAKKEEPERDSLATGASHRTLVENIWSEDADEQEEVPEEFTDLSPDEQQVAIKWRAFKMLALGTVMVIYFSDPMVDVMQNIAIRCNLSPFYVSFILAPLASNASEVIASQYYASKKTRKTITVSLSALEGAASMNNTFW